MKILNYVFFPICFVAFVACSKPNPEEEMYLMVFKDVQKWTIEQGKMSDSNLSSIISEYSLRENSKFVTVKYKYHKISNHEIVITFEYIITFGETYKIIYETYYYDGDNMNLFPIRLKGQEGLNVNHSIVNCFEQ